MSDTELLLLVESRKKSRFVAILLNIFLPGAGYIYCGRWFLGIAAFFFVVLLLVVSLGFAAIGLYIVLVVDAALCVGRYNRKMTEELIRSRAQIRSDNEAGNNGDASPIFAQGSAKGGWKSAMLYLFGAFFLVFLYAGAGLLIEKSDSALASQYSAPDLAEGMVTQDDEKQEWINEAQAEAEKLFKNYHAICNGKVVVRVGSSSYVEFSGASADVQVFGLYDVSEADKLNGKLWSGKMVVDMGQSSRDITVSKDRSHKASDWKYGREAEFDFVFNNGKWQVVEDRISSPDWNLKPDVTCKALGF